MYSPIRRFLWHSVVGLIALALLFVAFGIDTGAAQASALQQDTTKPITDTMPMGPGAMNHSMAMSETLPAHLEHMMARLEAMEARLAAMEKRMGDQADQGSQGGMMGEGGMMGQGGMMGEGGMMGQGGMMAEGGMMGNMAKMHAMMAEMHAQMAMMATMHGMMGQCGMMGQDGMMSQGGMMGQGASPAAPAPEASSGSAADAPAATDNAQTATLGAIEIKLTPVDLSDLSGETIAFTVDLNSSAGGLDLDLAKLAFIEAGMEVEAASWEVAFDHGHHVNGTLTFPLTHGGGHRYLEGAEAVTVVIHAPEGDDKVSFTWSLE